MSTATGTNTTTTAAPGVIDTPTTAASTTTITYSNGTDVTASSTATITNSNGTDVTASRNAKMKGGTVVGIIIGILILLVVLFMLVAGFADIDSSKVAHDDGLRHVNLHHASGGRWHSRVSNAGAGGGTDNGEVDDSPFLRQEQDNEMNGSARQRASAGALGSAIGPGWKSWMMPGSALQTHTRTANFQQYHHPPRHYRTPVQHQIPQSPRYLGHGSNGYGSGGVASGSSPYDTTSSRLPPTTPYRPAARLSSGGALPFNARSEFGVKTPAAGGNEFDAFMQNLAIGKPGGAIEAAELLKASRVNKKLCEKQRKLEKVLGIPASMEQPGLLMSTPAVEGMVPMSHQIARTRVADPQDATEVWTELSSAVRFASPGDSLHASVEAVRQENWRLQEDIADLEAKLGSAKEACGVIDASPPIRGDRGGRGGAAAVFDDSSGNVRSHRRPDWHQLAEKGGSGSGADGGSSDDGYRNGEATKKQTTMKNKKKKSKIGANDAFMAGHRAAGQLPPLKWREQAQHPSQPHDHSYA